MKLLTTLHLREDGGDRVDMVIERMEDPGGATEDGVNRVKDKPSPEIQKE